jgi:hypothetical protein
MIIKIIQFIHLILVILLICSVFIPDYKIKKYALTFLIFILIQYITNYGKCGLTELEYVIKGDQYQEGFIYRVVKPVISIPEKYFDDYMYLIHLIWIIILFIQLNK